MQIPHRRRQHHDVSGRESVLQDQFSHGDIISPKPRAESGQPFRFGYLGRGQLRPINALPASFPDFLLDFQ
ncbi:MAG: hypothetical protein DME24_24595 [Verrucomicrobia bacterium]|nr:MAG: hypothetical protein DME24_24595 [Verrucomicrobiota bacterium]